MAKKKDDQFDFEQFRDEKLFNSPRATPNPPPAPEALPAKLPSRRNQRSQVAPRLIAFTFNQIDVFFDDGKLVNLNDIHKSVGSPANKDPREWKRKSGASFVQHTASRLNVALSHIWKSTRGKNGGTWAHWQIALAYSKYLSDELHSFVNEAFKQWAAEQVAPAETLDRSVEALRKKGWTDDRIKARLDTKPGRSKICSEVSKRQCSKEFYANITDAVHIGVFGKNTKEIKAARGGRKGESARAVATTVELNLIQIAEEKIVQAWDNKRSIGNNQLLNDALPVIDLIKKFAIDLDAATGSGSGSNPAA